MAIESLEGDSALRYVGKVSIPEAVEDIGVHAVHVFVLVHQQASEVQGLWKGELLQYCKERVT